jgi:hypothetical protein
MLVTLCNNSKIVPKFIYAFDGLSDVLDSYLLALATSNLLQEAQAVMFLQEPTVLWP